jgi:predicted esterase
MTLHLTDEEKAMRDGRDGAAVAKAMDLLIRYGNALGAENLVETRNVCGTVAATTPFMRDFALKQGGLDAVFSEFNLDSAEVVAVPKVRAFSSHLQLGFDPHHPAEMGVDEQIVGFYRASEAAAARMGVQMLNTCTPYQVGNVPTRGEHCAWMESSAVIYINSVLGARTNAEGRESTSAAMLTCRIPNWGYHLDDARRATHHVVLDTPVESVEDWGLLGYWVGGWVQDRVPVISGLGAVPNLPRLKHFGAAASSSGGVDPNDPGPAPTRTCAINKNASGYFKLQSPAGEYWARLPNGYDPKAPAPTPLVAVLHGCGDNAQNFLEWGAVPPEVHNTHTYIAIAIENAAKNCWAAADEPRVLAAIDDVAECFWVHRKKVTLGGYSSGGVTAYTVALKNASRFDGLLAYKTGLPGGADALIAGAAWKFPIVHFAATGDGSFNITKVRQDWQKLKDAGFTVETIEKPGDHNGSADDWRIHLLPKAAPWKAP